MTIELTVHPDRGLAYFKFRGETDVAEGARAFVEYVDHPLFDPEFIMLSNTQDLESISASFTAIVMAVERLLPKMLSFRHPASSVIYAPKDVSFGMARMIQQLTEPLCRIRYQILRGDAEALLTCGQPETSFEELEQNLGILPSIARRTAGLRVL